MTILELEEHVRLLETKGKRPACYKTQQRELRTRLSLMPGGCAAQELAFVHDHPLLTRQCGRMVGERVNP